MGVPKQAGVPTNNSANKLVLKGKGDCLECQQTGCQNKQECQQTIVLTNSSANKLVLKGEGDSLECQGAIGGD
jgi:hypothetical protein